MTRIINAIEAMTEQLANLRFDDGAELMEVDDEEEDDYHRLIDLRD